MDELVDELRERNEGVPTPLELPDHDALVLVEEAILIHLPDEYKEFLLAVGDVICGSIEPATAADPQSHVYLPEMAAMAWDLGVPRDLIPICEHNDDYYCIQQDGEIVLWSNGHVEEETWDSIWYWTRDVWLCS